MLHIESIKVWISPSKEVRIYIKAWRGEVYNGFPQMHEGERYVTGNHFQAKGTQLGDLTEEEWAEAKRIGLNAERKWQNYRAPVSAEILAKRPAIEVPVMPSREVAATIRTAETVGSLVIVDDRILVVTESTYIRWDAEDDREDGWYTACAVPTTEERQTPEYVAISEHLAKMISNRSEEERRRAEKMAEVDALLAKPLTERHTAEEITRAEAAGIDLDLWDMLFTGTSDN